MEREPKVKFKCLLYPSLEQLKWKMQYNITIAKICSKRKCKYRNYMRL